MSDSTKFDSFNLKLDALIDEFRAYSELTNAYLAIKMSQLTGRKIIVSDVTEEIQHLSSLKDIAVNKYNSGILDDNAESFIEDLLYVYSEKDLVRLTEKQKLFLKQIASNVVEDRKMFIGIKA